MTTFKHIYTEKLSRARSFIKEDGGSCQGFLSPEVKGKNADKKKIYTCEAPTFVFIRTDSQYCQQTLSIQYSRIFNINQVWKAERQYPDTDLSVYETAQLQYITKFLRWWKYTEKYRKCLCQWQMPQYYSFSPYICCQFLNATISIYSIDM